MRRALAILFVLAFFRPLQAEEGRPELRIRIPHVVRVERISDDEHGTAFAVLGTLRLARPGLFTIEAERLVVWLDPRVDTKLFTVLKALRGEEGAIPIWAVRAIYAEGAGRAPLLFQAAGQILRASSLYYDFQRHEGLFLDTELRVRRRGVGPFREELPDLVFRAGQFRARGPGRWTARDVSLFSSDYVKPEVELRIRELEIENAIVRRALGRLILLSARGASTLTGPTAEELLALDGALADQAALQSGTVGKLYGVRARGFGIPVFGWRSLDLDGDSLDRTIVRAQLGRIGDMGRGAYLGVGKRSRPFGWYLGAGYVESHGPLVDTELELDAAGGRVRGRTTASYFQDGGIDFDGFVPPHEDRYWWQNRYRFQLTERLRFDAEYTLLSDANYLRIYDEREFKEGKPQESLGYLRWKDSWFYGTLIYQWQSIDFLEVKEQLPAAGLAVPTLTLLRLGEDGRGRPILLQLGLDTQLGNFRDRGGDPPAANDFRTPRFDLDPTLYAAFNLGALRITPFARFQYTWYGEALDGAEADRYAGSAGIRVDLELGRWFGDVQHLINVSVGYEDLYSVTLSPTRVFPMDAVDAVTPWEGFFARVRNRFLKKTPQGRREFLNFELVGTWFPEGEAPLGMASDGYLDLRAEWYPAPGWLVEGGAEYFSDDGTLQTAHLTGRWGTHGDVSFWAGFRHLHADSDVLTVGGEFLLEKRWRIVALSQFDVKNSEALDQSIILQRMGKTVLIGFGARYRPVEDKFSFSFKVDLLERFRSHRRARAEEELRRDLRFSHR